MFTNTYRDGITSLTLCCGAIFAMCLTVTFCEAKIRQYQFNKTSEAFDIVHRRIYKIEDRIEQMEKAVRAQGVLYNYQNQTMEQMQVYQMISN
jgi:hypothetical protein